jgi:hypothetical protein
MGRRVELLIAWGLLLMSAATYIWITRFATFDVAWQYGKRIQAANLVMAVVAAVVAIYVVRRSRETFLRSLGVVAIIASSAEVAWIGFLLGMSALMPGK